MIAARELERKDRTGEMKTMTEPLTALERQARDESLRLRDEAEGQAAKIAYLEAELKTARAEVTDLRARVKGLEGELHAAIIEAREHEERANASEHFLLPVKDGYPGEIDICDREDGHSHHFVPTSILDGYVTIELARLKDTIIAKLVAEKAKWEEALRFYADDGTHAPPGHSGEGWCRDSGHRARLALGLPSKDE